VADVREKFANYRPSKATLFWSCAGTAALTMALGFTWGGWVTGGSATEMAEASAQEARALLAADVCVERFLAAPDVRISLAALEEESSYSQDDFISEAGWTTFADAENPIDGAAELCAERLIEIELPEPTEPVAVEADASMQTEMPATEAAGLEDNAT
jgi:hypothetical protein